MVLVETQCSISANFPNAIAVNSIVTAIIWSVQFTLLEQLETSV